MDPATAAILAKAAQGFGEGLGTELGKKIFGGGDRKTAAQLKEINLKLREILGRIKALTRAIQELPNIIIDIVEKNELFKAEADIDAIQDFLEKNPELTQDEVSEDLFRGILLSWRIMIALEDRPEELIRISIRTEIVRSRLGTRYDSVLSKYIDAKLVLLDEEVARMVVLVDELHRRAAEIFATDSFKTSAFINEAPFITWERKSPKPQHRMEERLGKEHDRMVSVPIKENIAWNQRTQNRVAKLASIRAQLVTVVPPLALATLLADVLHQYRSRLSDVGSVHSQEFDDPDFQPFLDKLEESFRE